jgi:hypothetical protein
MSGTTPEPVVNVTQLPVVTNAANTRVLGYSTTTGDYLAIDPGALRGLTGPTGAAGPQGGPGPQGAVGPIGPSGTQGIQGPQGLAGPVGPAGRTILNGTTAPANSLGVNEDFYINRSSWQIHGPKAGGVWPAGQSLIGPQGPAGPAGASGGGGGTGNVQNGTMAGHVPVWDTTANAYVPQPMLDVTADHVPTVEVAAATALTVATHHRRNIVLIAAAPLTLSAAAAAAGFEGLVQNDTANAQNVTFAAGITVLQPANGTGTGGVVKIAPNGEIRIFVYPRQGALIAKIRGDVA